jgi:hypothetical protein
MPADLFAYTSGREIYTPEWGGGVIFRRESSSFFDLTRDNGRGVVATSFANFMRRTGVGVVLFFY